MSKKSDPESQVREIRLKSQTLKRRPAYNRDLRVPRTEPIIAAVWGTPSIRNQAHVSHFV